VMGWLPTKKICVFHVFEDMLHHAETAICLNDLAGAPLGMVGDKCGTAQALLTQALER
jgi:hypothetical protein